MEQILHRTADESTYYAPPPGKPLLCTTTNNYFSGQLFSLLSFPKQSEGLQVKLPLVTLFDFMRGNLERCHQFDDGTRQMMKLAYQEALANNVCSNLLEIQKEVGPLDWNKAGENGFTFASHLTNKLEIEIIWDTFNRNTIALAPNITQATLDIKTKLRLGIQIEDEQIQVECLNIDEAEFMTTITGQTRRYSIQCDGQSKCPSPVVNTLWLTHTVPTLETRTKSAKTSMR